MQIMRFEERGPRGAGDVMCASENFLDDDGAVEVLLQFRGGEMWAAINVLARERELMPASALQACVAFGLMALGYDVPAPVLVPLAA